MKFFKRSKIRAETLQAAASAEAHNRAQLVREMRVAGATAAYRTIHPTPSPIELLTDR